MSHCTLGAINKTGTATFGYCVMLRIHSLSGSSGWYKGMRNPINTLKETLYTMVETKSLGASIFFCLCIFTWNITCTSVENGFMANYSKSIRYTVPKNLPLQTTVLDLSQNRISEIQMSDFGSLSKLKALILSYNLIRRLDFSVFQYNKHLEHLDLSHNNLQILSGHPLSSLSEHDSDWVKNVLIPNLEKEDGSIRICQHKRNFVAGKSIVENIIDCIEKSYKTIFVLSPNFVQSEWCHYELYFAHHKVFSEDHDSLILVLLESIPAYIVPARYHKLKALMAKRTYLEWPKERSKHGLFWANLRAAIQIKISNESEEMKIL
nr:toll-like receptor 6 isoform X3 [Pogona vitticeps]